jgi:hypothetical protein
VIAQHAIQDGQRLFEFLSHGPPTVDLGAARSSSLASC